MSLLLLFVDQSSNTSIAQLSMQPAATPATRTNHTIVIRARVPSGPGTGLIRAALYESGINRSGDLSTSPLTTSFVDYNLSIPDANAAFITGYTNLEVRLYGVSFISTPVVFEVSEVKLVIPTPTSSTAFIAAGSDSGVGTDSATLSVFSPSNKSGGDQGSGADIASVASSVTPTPGMPALALEVSFDADSGPNYKEAVMIAQPQVYYRLGESSGPVIDQEANLNLTASPGGITRSQASLLPGDSDQCYDFNGTSGYLGAPDNGQFNCDELTLEGMFSLDSTSGVMTLLQRFHQGSNPHDIWRFFLNNGYPSLIVAGAVPIPEEGTPPIEPTLYTYKSNYLLSTSTYHLAVVVTPLSIDFYVEGVRVDNIPKSWLGIYKSTTSIFTIGSGWNGTAYSQFFNGRIDEPAVFLRELEPEDISYHSAARSAVSTYTWTLISGDASSNSFLKELSIRRGAQDIFRNVETGVFVGVLHNNDRRFDPGQTTGPYYPNLKPARPMRLRATKDGVSRNLFRGDVEDWPQDWKGRENDVPVTALDALDVLSGVDMRISRPVEMSGTRIHAILDHAAWPQELRLIDAGEEPIAAWINKEGSAQDLLFLVKNAESGYLYINGLGQVVFQQRNKRFAPPFSTVKAVFSNIPGAGEFPIVEADVVEDKDQIKNHIRIKIEDTPNSAVAQDAQSILDHRKRSHEEELPLTSITSAQLRAEWILSQYKTPIFRITDVVVEPQMDSALWAHCLDREIGDRLRFKIYPPGKPGTMHDLQANIEYVEHKYTVGRWTTLWKVSVADISHYWILDTDQLGVGTKLAY